MTTLPKRLYRSQTDRVIAGVCGGVAEYLNLDPSIVRIVWVLVAIFGGWGVLLYIVAWIVVPINPAKDIAPHATRPNSPQNKTTVVVGGTLLALGVIILMSNLDIFSLRYYTHIIWRYALPSLLILVGAYLVFRPDRSEGTAGKEATEPGASRSTETSHSSQRRLQRSATDRMLFGVCAGLSEYFEIDPAIARILFVVFTLTSFGFGILIYVLLIFVMSEKTSTTTSS